MMQCALCPLSCWASLLAEPQNLSIPWVILSFPLPLGEDSLSPAFLRVWGWGSEG